MQKLCADYVALSLSRSFFLLSLITKSYFREKCDFQDKVLQSEKKICFQFEMLQTFFFRVNGQCRGKCKTTAHTFLSARSLPQKFFFSSDIIYVLTFVISVRAAQ
jgi:hypothetical protein